MTPSHRERAKQRGTNRKPRDHYDVAAYGQAIRVACDRLWPTKAKKKTMRNPNPKPADPEVAEANAKRHWAPNQLRHSRRTEVRAQFGLEAAQVVLGHAHAAVTEVYAERDAEKARAVAMQTG